MASNRPLPGDIKETGVDQVSLVKWMQNVTDLVNELQTDHATILALSAANKTAVNAIITAAAATGAAIGDIGAVTAVTAAAPATLANATALTLNRS